MKYSDSKFSSLTKKRLEIEYLVGVRRERTIPRARDQTLLDSLYTYMYIVYKYKYTR